MNSDLRGGENHWLQKPILGGTDGDANIWQRWLVRAVLTEIDSHHGFTGHSVPVLAAHRLLRKRLPCRARQ